MNQKLTTKDAQRIGRIGGSKTALIHGPEFFAEIGRKGGLMKAKNRQKAAIVEA